MKKTNKMTRNLIVKRLLVISIFLTLAIVLVGAERLPISGSDLNIWGDILNDYLRVSHGVNGSIDTTTDAIFSNITVDKITDNTIFAQLSSPVDQNPQDTNPTVINYTVQDSINGITHSTTINSGEITIDVEGMYFVSPQPQVGKTSGSTAKEFDMFLQIDTGSGFVDENNSNVKLTVKDQDLTDVIISVFTIKLNVGDKIRIMQRVSDAGVGLGLKNTDPVSGTPRTPSIIFTMYRIGG